MFIKITFTSAGDSSAVQVLFTQVENLALASQNLQGKPAMAV